MSGGTHGAVGGPVGDRGSALLMSIFVLVLLSGMGTALLFLSRNEARMSQTSVQLKQAFYLAETGVEDGRVTLFAVHDGSFSDDLLAAAGGNGLIDFDPDTLIFSYDTNGNVAGISGFDDDVPLRSLTQLGTPDSPGWYVAFLTNDPQEGAGGLTDNNDRVMITGVGAGGRGRAVEVVQAIIRPHQLLPSLPAAAITMLGPAPAFDNGTDPAQSHSGDDCGVPGGAFAPIIGTIDDAAKLQVQGDMYLPGPGTFTSGSFSDLATVGDLTNPADPIVSAAGHGTIDPFWMDCLALKDKLLELAANADYYCAPDLGSCTIPATGPDSIVFIDGDLAVTPSGSHQGMLVVTGQLTYDGATDWDGIVLAIGEGSVQRTGSGGNPSGAVVIGAIDPTPSGPSLDKSDWCTSPPNGFTQAQYTSSATSTVAWCPGDIAAANAIRNYRVIDFLQR